MTPGMSSPQAFMGNFVLLRSEIRRRTSRHLLTLFTRHNLESCGNIDGSTCLNFARQGTEMHIALQKAATDKQTWLIHCLNPRIIHLSTKSSTSRLPRASNRRATTGLTFDRLIDDAFIDQLKQAPWPAMHSKKKPPIMIGRKVSEKTNPSLIY